MPTEQPTKDHYRAWCQHYDIPLFHQDWWLDIVSANWAFKSTHKGDNLLGIWPYTLDRRAGIDILRNPPLCPYLGPHVIYPKDLKPAKNDGFEHDTIAALMEKMPLPKVCSVAIRPGIKQIGLFRHAEFTLEPRQTFLIDLQAKSLELLFADLHEDARRNIKKAEAEMVISNEPDLLPLLFDFQKATLDRKEVEMHFSQAQMKALFAEAFKRGQTALWVARKEGEVQAILWNLWDESRGYYLVGSKSPLVKDSRAMTALIWQAIKHSAALGKHTFDFEGSMVPGVERFFRTMGARREMYLVLHKDTSIRWKLINWIRRR